MSYTKFTWTDLTAITGKGLNHLESQWTQIYADILAHNHDDRYFEKAASDTTFYSLTFMGQTALVDADKLDGSHLASVISAALPVGAILVWSGQDSTVPSGWHVCDGTAGTPDLRGRFIIGAGGSYAPGNTGGAATAYPTASLTVDEHILTIDEIPSHNHQITDYYMTTSGGNIHNGGTSALNSSLASRNTLTGNPESYGTGHGHPNSALSINSQDNRPSYQALYYIMKVS